MQVDGGNAGIRQRFRQLLGVVLGAHEQDATALTRSELTDELVLFGDRGHLEDVVGHRRHVGGGFVNRVQHLVVEVLAHELVDAVVQCCAEQHALATLWGLVHDAGDDRQEAEVGHVVGLIQHGDFDGVEGDETLLHEVFEATGAGDDNVDTSLERCDLALLGNATKDGGGVQAIRLSEGLQHVGDLGGELTGGREHEGKGAARATLATGELSAESRNERDGEGKGLTRAGLPTAENVATVESVGKRVHLDGESAGEPLSGQSRNEGGWHAERAERDISHESVKCLSGIPLIPLTRTIAAMLNANS